MSNDVVSQFDLEIVRIEGFEFRVHFSGAKYADLTADEPPPLGHDAGPNPTRLLAAAVGNCLAASLLFCLQRSGTKAEDMKADVHVQLVRNEQKRLRVGTINVTLRPRLAGGAEALQKCLGTFEDFCVVTQSVRAGLDVQVKVEPQ